MTLMYINIVTYGHESNGLFGLFSTGIVKATV